MKKICVLILFGLFCNGLFSQVFNSTYQAENPNFQTILIKDIEPLSSGEYLAAIDYIFFGYYWTPGVMKLSEDGSVLWLKHIYTDQYREEYAHQVIENAAGNYYALYTRVDYLTHKKYVMLLEMDPDGEILWVKFYDYGEIYGLFSYNIPHSFTVLPIGDLQLVIAGDEEIIIYRLDAVGNILWGKKTDRINIGVDHAGLPWAELPGEEGVVSYKAEEDKANLVKMDNDGSILWSKALTLGNSPNIKSILPLPSGDLLIGGYSGNEDSIAFIMKIDEMDGSVIWSKRIGGYESYARSRMHFSQREENIWIELSGFNTFYYLEISEDGDLFNAMQMDESLDVFNFNRIEHFSDGTDCLYGGYRNGDNHFGFIEITNDPYAETCIMAPTTLLGLADFMDYEMYDFVVEFSDHAEILEDGLPSFDLDPTVAQICLSDGLTDSDMDKILVYPNPTSDNIRIDLPENINNANYTLTDLSGKLVLSGRINANAKQISLHTLADGQYILSVQIEDKLITEKIKVIH